MEIDERIDAIEECYEYQLAFAAKGIDNAQGGELRHYLVRAADAMTGLAEACPMPSEAFRKVLARDAEDSLAAVQLVLMQPVISSQLIDNLNASMHLRALLTDLFLVDEVLKLQARCASKDASEVALGVDSADSLLETVPPDNN
jgi:hypothetical protein